VNYILTDSISPRLDLEIEHIGFRESNECWLIKISTIECFTCKEKPKISIPNKMFYM
jgi:hypothetical protein